MRKHLEIIVSSYFPMFDIMSPSVSRIFVFVLLFFVTKFMSSNALVEVENEQSAPAYSKLVFDSICSTSPNCSNLEKITFDYENVTVLFYQDEIVQTISSLDKQSSLTSPYSQILMYSNLNFTFNLFSLCENTQMTLIVLEWSVTEMNVSKAFNGCISEYYYETGSFLKYLITKCRNLVWFHNIDCNQRSISYHSQNVVQRNTTFKRENLINKTLRITFHQFSPFIKISDAPNATNYTGVMFEMLNRLVSQFNFKYEIVEPVDSNYGALVNNTWNGEIGMLIRDEVDIALTPLTITYQRTHAVDFSFPLYFESVGIMIRYHQPHASLMAITGLYRPSVWCLFTLCILMAMVITYVLNKLTVGKEEDKTVDTFLGTCWYIYSMQMNQKAERIITQSSLRIFEIFWRIFSFLIISVYTGGFVAFLAIHRFHLPFKTLEQFSEAVSVGTHKACVTDGSSIASAILGNESTDYVKLQTFFESNPSYITTTEDCIDKLLTEPNVGLICELTTLREVQTKYCDKHLLIILSDRFFPGYLAMAFQKNSSYSSVLSEDIRYVVENGLVQYWYLTHSNRVKAPYCQIYEPDYVSNPEMTPLTIFQVGGSFILLLLGAFTGFILFLFEQCYDQLHPHNKQQIRCR